MWGVTSLIRSDGIFAKNFQHIVRAGITNISILCLSGRYAVQGQICHVEGVTVSACMEFVQNSCVSIRLYSMCAHTYISTYLYVETELPWLFLLAKFPLEGRFLTMLSFVTFSFCLLPSFFHSSVSSSCRHFFLFPKPSSAFLRFSVCSTLDTQSRRCSNEV